MRRKPRRVYVDPHRPKAWGTSDHSGHIGHHEDLCWQHEWAGNKLINLKLLVFPDELDKPQRQLGTIVLPPDPPPIMNARVEPYALEEQPVSARITIDKRIRVVRYLPHVVERIVSVAGNLANAIGLLPSAFDPASLAIFSAFTTAPTNARQTLINTFVVALKNAGVWPLLDFLYVFAAADSQAARVNWVNPGTFTATNTGTSLTLPTFLADRGFQGDGATTFIDSTFNPTVGSHNFTATSASGFGRVQTANATNRVILGASAGTPAIVDGGVNLSTTGFYVGPPLPSAAKFYAASQTGGALSYYENGSVAGTLAGTSAALNNATLWTLNRQNSEYSTDVMASFGAGGFLTAGQVSALNAAELAYMQGVGAA